MRYPIVQIGRGTASDLTGKSFVGVSRIDESSGEATIVVPYGLELESEISDNDPRQKEQYEFLRRYVKVIQKALSGTKERMNEKAGIHNPIAAVNLLHDFLSMGKFIEYETISELSERGTLDFNQTVKKVKPSIVGEDLYFDRYITRKRVTVANNFVGDVQCSVINHFMKHGGVILFGQSVSVPHVAFELDKPAIAESVLKQLQKEFNNTFNSRKESIIRWSISYIKGLRNLNEKGSDDGDWKYAIVASSLWEVMLDSVLGNQTKRDKTKYGKKYEFTYFDGRKESGPPTQHDTIYEDEESLIIIDAKMYGAPTDLLSEHVLGKQFGYYEQAKLEKAHSNEKKNIINILVLPYYKKFDSQYFQNKIILDPHTTASDDPYKIVFIYAYPVKELIDDYYEGRKKSEFLLDQFKKLIQDPGVAFFLEERHCEYHFKEMPEVHPYEAWDYLNKLDAEQYISNSSI